MAYNIHICVKPFTHSQFRTTNESNLTRVFGVWEETDGPCGNPRRHMDNMQTPDSLDSDPGSFCCEVLLQARGCWVHCGQKRTDIVSSNTQAGCRV